MSTQSKISEEVVRQFARGLNTLDLDLIAPILHPDFKFLYETTQRDCRIIAHSSRLQEALLRNPNRKHGIRTDLRYIGYMYKVFMQMKKDGHVIKTDFFTHETRDEILLGVVLLPPHERAIIYPMEDQLRKELRSPLPLGGAFFKPRIKDGLICKIEHIQPY